VIEADVPESLFGPVLNAHVVGALPCQWKKIWGLFWDPIDGKLYQTCHNDYDGNPSIDATLSRGRFEDGQLVSEGQWAFAGRPDKMTEGGVTALPAWFVAEHPALQGARLAAGFGGYRSMVAVGPASMGAALTAFGPPGSGARDAVANVPLVGYPFTNVGDVLRVGGFVERMHRTADYINDFGGDETYPIQPVAVGYTTWADWCQQCGTWVDAPGVSGLLMIWQRGIGRLWYTNTINAEAWRYDLVVYAPEDLGKVADGADETSIQPIVDVPFPMPGIAQPDAGGRDNPPHVVTGVAFEPNSRLLFIGVKAQFSRDPAEMATAILVFRVIDDR
jgi:hypothetical protein